MSQRFQMTINMPFGFPLSQTRQPLLHFLPHLINRFNVNKIVKNLMVTSDVTYMILKSEVFHIK